MWILAFFTDNGEPALGLSPIVTVLDVETGYTVVSGESMSETGDGFYKYDFSIYEPARDYAIICDSVTLSGTERYTYASSGEYAEVLNSIESTVGMVDIRTSLLRKIQTNRLELDDGDIDNWTLYDDDSSTPLMTFSVTDKNGNLIIQHPHTPSRRSMADGDICGSGISPSADIYMRKSVYDSDEDGIVSTAEGVSDGIYSSTASGIKYAVDNAHPRHQLGNKFVDESGMSDQFVLKYDRATDRIIYGLTNISGTLSGTIYHNWLLDLLNDDHPQYILASGTRPFSSTVSGVYPVEDDHLATKSYVDDQISSLGLDYYTKEEVLDLIGQNKAGKEHLSLGDIETTVIFSTAFTADGYALLVSLENTNDIPASEYALTITDTTISGFTVHYSGDIDSDNYYLNWYATLSGVAGGVIREFSRGLSDPDLTSTYVVNRVVNNYGINAEEDLLIGGKRNIVLDTTPSGNYLHGYIVGASGEISKMHIDSNFNGFGSPLYVKSNGHLALCTAASGTMRMPCIALSMEEGTGFKSILWRGIARKGSWNWKPSDVIYVSTVEGALTNIEPKDGSWAQPVGVAIATDVIRFEPGYNHGKINL